MPKVGIRRDPLIRVANSWNKTLNATVDSWIGTPYKWGGTSRGGADCSGFVRGVFRETLHVELPRNSRAQHKTGTRVDQKQLNLALRYCLDRLGERYRQSVELYYLAEAGDCAHCAEQSGVTATAFMQRLSRARIKLGQCLARRVEMIGKTGGVR